MPAISRILEVLLYSVAMFLPWLVITYYPFRSRLRFSPRLIALGVAVLAIGRIALDLTAAWGLGASTPIHVVLVLLYIGCYAASVKASPVEAAVNMALVAALGFVCDKATGMLFRSITSHLSLSSYSWFHSIMLLGLAVVVCLIYCLLYDAIKNRIQAQGKDPQPAQGSDSAPSVSEAEPAPKKHLFRLPRKKADEIPAAEVAGPAVAEPAAVEPACELPSAAENTAKEESAPNASEEGSAPEEAPVVSAQPTSAVPPAPQPVMPEPAPEVSQPVQVSPVPDLEQLRSMQFTSLNTRILESRQLRKDLRRQIDTMTECLRSKNYERLQAMLLAMRQQFSTTSYSSNAALSAPLDYFAQIAHSRNIPMNIDVQLPEDGFAFIDPADLILILGNLLDNALEACKTSGNPQISVSVKPYGTSLRLVVKNTNSQPVRCNEQGQYLSGKYDGPGAGLMTVQAIVRRYQGKLEIKEKDGRFCVRVTLNP